MCTYRTESIDAQGSGKGAGGWFSVSQATVYFDHPQHVGLEHSLNIDFLNPDLGPAARVALELTEETARQLAAAILTTLDSAPPGLASAKSPTTVNVTSSSGGAGRETPAA